MMSKISGGLSSSLPFSRKAFARPHFWIIDGLDEFIDFYSLFPLLANIGDFIRLRIFVTSRSVLDIAVEFERPGICSRIISIDDTTPDIELFLRFAASTLPFNNTPIKKYLINRLSAKARGCFLWAHLIIRELKTAYTTEQFEEIVENIPTGMENLYSRIHKRLSQGSRGNAATKATWHGFPVLHAR